MSPTRRNLTTAAATAAVTTAMMLALVAPIYASGAHATASTQASANDQAPLVQVETKRVCMINDQLFGRDQIPVEVDGRTYYGCCAMCKDRLANDAASRTAVDPETGKKVDKATAVIGARPDGSVLYFESVESLERHAKKLG